MILYLKGEILTRKPLSNLPLHCFSSFLLEYSKTVHSTMLLLSLVSTALNLPY